MNQDEGFWRSCAVMIAGRDGDLGFVTEVSGGVRSGSRKSLWGRFGSWIRRPSKGEEIRRGLCGDDICVRLPRGWLGPWLCWTAK